MRNEKAMLCLLVEKLRQDSALCGIRMLLGDCRGKSGPVRFTVGVCALRRVNFAKQPETPGTEQVGRKVMGSEKEG